MHDREYGYWVCVINMPGKKTVKWNDDTMRTILAARDELENLGMRRPSIRAVLYLLLRLPGWTKKHYDTLTVKLGEWRDAGKIPWGLFSDDGGGASYRPLTSTEIVERIKSLQDLVPAKTMMDGYLHTVLVEHISLVDTIAEFLDFQIPVVSSQGQLRREHLYTSVSNWFNVIEELNGKGVRCIALTDYDSAGMDIFESHRRWLEDIFDLEIDRWAVTVKQIKDARLPVHEPHQLDGFIAAYGPQRFKTELRKVVGLNGASGRR